MKLLAATTHAPGGRMTAAAEDLEIGARAALDFDEIYERHFAEVERWIRALGGPAMDLEDLAQEIFLVVKRKLGGFDGRNLRGWLFRITRLTVSDHRRRTWFRNLFARRSEVEIEDLRSSGPSPAEALEKKERALAVHRLLGEISETRRVAFVLHEVNGYSGEEIAELLQIPIKTVWTRIHYARKDFVALVEREGSCR